MKKKLENVEVEDRAMLPEYDFSGRRGVRGRYHHAYSQGHTVQVHREDGSVSTRHFTLEEGAVLLEPDVREYFPDSDSVNTALRSLIALIPEKQPKKKRARKPAR